jgi:CheY-like chemotaxis protein
MPIMDGLELVEAMNADEELRGVPVVVITAKTLTADDRARLRAQTWVKRTDSDSGQLTQTAFCRSL